MSISNDRFASVVHFRAFCCVTCLFLMSTRNDRFASACESLGLAWLFPRCCWSLSVVETTDVFQLVKKKKKKNPPLWVLQRACNTGYLVLSEGLDTESTTLTPRRCVCMFLWCLLRPTCFPGHTMHRPIHHILYRGCQILVNGRLSISRVTAGHEIESEAEMCKTSEMVCVQ